ncbi:MAG: glycosyltransferase [Fibrobacterota bacterium]
MYTIPALLCALLFITLTGLCLFTALQRRRYTPGTQKNFNPACAIIIPCKGACSDLEENLESFFHLEEKSYEILFTVESNDDPAAAVIDRITARHSRGKKVIAGITTGGCQKNHNLLAAAEIAESTDILVFADSDIDTYPTWLQAITAPLADSSVTAATGFRWLYPDTVTPGAAAHALQNQTIFATFSLSSALWNGGLWGGSTAIRRTDFDRLNVAGRWRETAVDDLSLSELLRKNGAKTVLAYDCITPTHRTISRWRDALRWYRRQVMYLKIHQSRDWIAAFAAAIIYTAGLILSPFALAEFIQGAPFMESALLPTILILGPMLQASTFPLMGKSRHTAALILLAPLSMVSIMTATLWTALNNRISWSGYIYSVKQKDGTVTHIERL